MAPWSLSIKRSAEPFVPPQTTASNAKVRHDAAQLHRSRRMHSCIVVLIIFLLSVSIR